MSLAKILQGIGFAGLAIAIPSVAAAQVCAKDADCVAGYTCHTETVTSGTSSACAKNEVCAPTTTTTTTTYSFCQPKSCATAGDCGAGQVCHTTEFETCSGGSSKVAPCKVGTTGVGDCPTMAPDPTPMTCTKSTTSVCAFKWQLPCDTDAECGAGFRCQPMTYGSCTGSTGVAIAAPTQGTSSSGSGVEPAGRVTGTGGSTTGGSTTGGSTCTTVSSYPGRCVSQATTCVTNADCPSPFLCQESMDGVVSTAPVATGGSKGLTPLPDPMPVIAKVKTCVSPLAEAGTDIAVSVPKGTTNATAGGVTSTAPTAQTPATGRPSSEIATTGVPSSETATSGGGCQMGRPAQGSFAWLTLLGLVGLLLKRGRRA